MKLNKKGAVVNLMLHPLFRLVIAGGVLLLILFVLGRATDEARFDKQFLATDFALTVDTLYTLPGTVFFTV